MPLATTLSSVPAATTQKKKGFFKSFWKKSKHYSLDQWELSKKQKNKFYLSFGSKKKCNSSNGGSVTIIMEGSLSRKKKFKKKW